MTTVPPAKLKSISFGPGSPSESSAGARSAGARRRSAGTVPCGSDEGVWERGCSASDSQVRLQAAADQADSKRFGDPKNRGGRSSGAGPADDWSVVDALAICVLAGVRKRSSARFALSVSVRAMEGLGVVGYCAGRSMLVTGGHAPACEMLMTPNPWRS
jgi:hypothetical protein